MKKRVLTVSLSLLACLCCCFSGLGSVKAFASYSTYPQYDCTIPKVFVFQVLNGSQYYADLVRGDDTNYHLTEGQGWVNNSDVYISTFMTNTSETDDKFYFPINTNLFDYYLISTLSVDQVGDDFTISDFDIGNFSSLDPINFISSNILSDKKIYYSRYDVAQSATSGIQLITCTAKLNLDYVGDLNLGMFHFDDVNGGLYYSTKSFTCSVIVANKGDTSAYNEIISAINDQTTSLGGKLDSIDQTIQDQYEIEDEEDFGFSDIQQQYEEKMGVLTFGTETTIQMLELFSPSNAGEAYIRVPGWSMEIQGETYQIWDEYIFYFDSIEENFPFLVTTMRTFTVAMFYVAIVGYITKVYERNFLAK